MRKLALAVILFVSLQPAAYAAISISIDGGSTYTNNFGSSGDLTGIEWENGGGSINYNATGSWDGGGCAEIIPPTSGQCTNALGSFLGINETTLYVAFTVKVGSALYSTAQNIGFGIQNKAIIVLRSTGVASDRSMLMLESEPLGSYYAWQACSQDNDNCRFDDGCYRWDPCGNESIRHPPDNDWIWIKSRFVVGGLCTVTITERDGTTKTWNTSSNATSGGYWSQVQSILGYWNGQNTTSSSNHIYIDNLVIDDADISVPAGFTTGGDTTSPTVTITSPTSNATYDNGSTGTITIGGSASDNVAVSSVAWVNSLGGSGACSGTTSWTASDIALTPGSNVNTVTATDSSSNTGNDTITVSYSIPTVQDAVGFQSGTGNTGFGAGIGSVNFQ
jgi:hypothetical protein